MLGAIRFMPGAPAYVLGLRAAERPGAGAVADRAARAQVAGQEDGGIAIVVEAEGGLPYSLIVDHALGIVRVAPEMIFALDGDMAGVSHYMVMEDGRLLRSVASGAGGAGSRRTVAPEAPGRARRRKCGWKRQAHRDACSACAGRKLFRARSCPRRQHSRFRHPVALLAMAPVSTGWPMADRVVPVKDLRRIFTSPRNDIPPCVLLQLQERSPHRCRPGFAH